MASRIALPTCARCGAPLALASGEERPRCAYCGARSVVEKDRAPGGSDPIPVDTLDLAALAKLKWIAGVALGLIVVISAFGAFAQRVHFSGKLGADVPPPIVDHTTLAQDVPRKPEPRPAPVYPTTILAGLVLDDIDKDGIEDIVGAFENATPAHERWLGVLSGADGHEIWARRAKDVMGDAMLEQTLRAVVMGRLIVADPSGRVQTLQEWDGAPDWNRTLAAPARDLCAGAHHLLFRLADGSQVPLAVDTGVPLSAPPDGACEPIATSRSDGPNFRVAIGPEAVKIAGPAAAQLVVARALVPFVGTARVLLGADRTSGRAAIAMVSAGKRVWQTTVEPDAVPAVVVESERATVRYGEIVLSYPMESGGLRVSCFELASGSRSWGVTLPDATTAPDGEIAISRDRRVIVRTAAGRLRVLALVDGAELPMGGGAGAQSR